MATMKLLTGAAVMLKLHCGGIHFQAHSGVTDRIQLFTGCWTEDPTQLHTSYWLQPPCREGVKASSQHGGGFIGVSKWGERGSERASKREVTPHLGRDISPLSSLQITRSSTHSREGAILEAAFHPKNLKKKKKTPQFCQLTPRFFWA